MPDTPRRRERVADAIPEHARHEAGSGPRQLPAPFSAPAPTARAPLPSSPAGLPAPPAEIWAIVDEGAAALGVELSAASRAALDAQLRLLLAWNEHVNLTALRSPQQVARGHLLDSLSAVALVRRLCTDARGPASATAAGGRVARPGILDLGSGAGYPGLPLAVVVPAARCALVDSVGKKAAFLAVAGAAAGAAMTGLGQAPPLIEALAERAEDLAREGDQREAWDIVVARAVGSLAEVLELGLPLVRVGGHVVAWKREAAPGALREEINSARQVTRAAGADHPFVVAPDRPGAAGLADHRLVVARKVRPTPDRYPRPPAERRRELLR